MKKLALLMFVAFQAISVQAQQTIDFKIAYKPNTVYKQTSQQNTKTTVSYGEGMEPMDQEAKINMVSTTTIGKVTNGTMPVTIKVEPEKGSDAAALMPNGATIYGIIKQDGQPKLDSISSQGMQEQMKAVFLNMVSAMTSQSLVPARKVKVGESFTIDTPTEIPMGPVTMVLTTKSTYKLNKVEGKKAYFDVNVVVDISAKDKNQNLKGSGTGSGSMIYDMDNNFFTTNNLKSTSKTEMDIQGMKMSFAEERDIKATVEIATVK